eukprot:201834_1
MDCKIPSTSVKHFTRAINCLAKIGESINFEITPTRFILRTLGEAEAAYFQIDFSTRAGVFFEKYDCYYQREITIDNANADTNHNNNNDNNPLPNENESFTTTSSAETNRTIKARIKSKIFLSTFRLNDSAQSVDLKFNAELNKLDITSTFLYNITRNYTIRFEDIPTILQAEFSSNSNALKEISCPSHTFKRMLFNFANSLQEITLIVSAQGLAIKSFIDVMSSAADSICTECHINRSEFTTFSLHLPSNLKQIILTVVQKEFKAFLTLCEALEEPIQIFLTFGGQPILLTNQTPMHLRNPSNTYVSGKGIGIKLIMATISDESQQIDIPQPPDQPQSTTASQSSSRNHNNSEIRSNSRHIIRQPRQQNDDLLAQAQSTPSVASARSIASRNNNNGNELMSVHLDDDDVMMDMPTHGQFDTDPPSQFLPNTTVNTTQHMTTVHDTEIQENESQHARSVSLTRSAQYKMLQPHPDSITPPHKGQRLGNKENQGDFNVNVPETEDHNANKKTKKRQYDERTKQLVPSSSESRHTLKQKRQANNVINLVDDDHENDSLELQYVSDENRNRNHNNNNNNNRNKRGRVADYLSSYLDHVDNRAYSMTQTQPAIGGQIAHRFEKERQNERSHVECGDRNRKRRMDQNHYGNDNMAKRQRYNDNATSYTSTLRKKPKSKWQPSPDDL